MWPPRTILHPTDFSEHAIYAMRVANSLARSHSALLVVLHVMPAPHPAGMLPPGHHPKRDYTAMRKEILQLEPLDEAVQRKPKVLEGEPAPNILRLAKDIDADLIIMGTHGRTGLKHLLYGSVAEVVVRKAACPVLTVRTPVAEQEPLAELPAKATTVADA